MRSAKQPPMSNINGSASNFAATSRVQRPVGFVSAKKSFMRARMLFNISVDNGI